MALIYADGFDHYGTGATGKANMLKGAWASISGYYPSATMKRTGVNSLGSSGSAIEARMSLRGPRTVIGVGYGLWMSQLPSSNSQLGMTLRSGSNASIVTLVPTTDGSIAVKSGSYSGTVLGTTDSVLTASTFHHIEAKFVLDPVVGSCEIKVNGVLVFSLSNINLGSEQAASLAFVMPSGLDYPTHYIDDLIVWDDTGSFNNTFMGPQRILTLFPDGDGSDTAWSTTGSANGFECIDEVPPDGDTSYIASASVGDKSSFTLPTLPPETVGVAGVVIPAMGRIDEAGLGNIKVAMLSGASESVGPEITLTPGYSYYSSVFESDPATGVAWTKSGFEASLVRVEKTL